MGQFGRLRRRSFRNSCHSLVAPGSTSSKRSRPAVSRMTAWLVNHQFMFSVPPTPWSWSCSPGGKPTLQWRTASVLPEPGSPTSRYHGRAYRFFPAARNLSTPPSKFLRRSSSRARRAGSVMAMGVMPALEAIERSMGADLRRESIVRIARYEPRSAPVITSPATTT